MGSEEERKIETTLDAIENLATFGARVKCSSDEEESCSYDPLQVFLHTCSVTFSDA